MSVIYLLFFAIFTLVLTGYIVCDCVANSSDSATSRRAELEKQVKEAEEAARAASARYDTAHNDAAQARAFATRTRAAADQHRTQIKRQLAAVG